jgi:hypothetical protein
MDGMSPLPRTEVDARYDLSRLAELLPGVEAHLRTLGVDGATAGDLGLAAHELRRGIARAREAALRDQAKAVPA